MTIKSSFEEAKVALSRGEVDVVGYPAVYRLNSKKYDVIATLNSIPNSALVVATAMKDSSSVQDVLALLNNIPKQSQYPGLGNIMRFASVQSTPYTYWMKQISQSGLFTAKACQRVEKAEEKAKEKVEEKAEVNN